jgi:uncharacterized delta-60 repeat protein
LVVLCACGSSHDAIDGAPATDAAIDAAVDAAPDAMPDAPPPMCTVSGALDPSFIGAPVFSMTNAAAAATAVDASGRIVVVGGTYLEGSPGAVVRYQSDGSLDPTFGSGGVVRYYNGGYGVDLGGVVIQPDGKIIAVGTSVATILPDEGDVIVLRYLTDGSLDPAFGTDGVGLAHIGDLAGANGVVLDGDGRIVVSVSIEIGDNDPDYMSAARFTADGALDPTFGTDGFAPSLYAGRFTGATGVALDSHGDILTSGIADDQEPLAAQLAAVRYTPDGALDDTFTVHSMYPDGGGGFGVLVDGDAVVVVGGDNVHAVLARFLADGSPDPAFDGVVNVDGGFLGAVLAPGGGYYGAGTDGPGNIAKAFITRLDASGAVDPAFGVTITATTHQATFVNGMTIQADGKPIIVGETIDGNGDTYTGDFYIARYCP